MSSACAPSRRRASLRSAPILSSAATAATRPLRERAGLPVEDIGAPIDVLWFRVSRRTSDPDDVFGHAEAGRMMVMLNRGEYWQCAYVIPKGGIDRVKEKGLPAFRDAIVEMSPFLATASARSEAGTT